MFKTNFTALPTAPSVPINFRFLHRYLVSNDLTKTASSKNKKSRGIPGFLFSVLRPSLNPQEAFLQQELHLLCAIHYHSLYTLCQPLLPLGC
jgi:hypothetical protein